MALEVTLWLIALATGLLVAVMSSRWSVNHLTRFAASTRIPPFVIGITVVSIGTDLPEIANSIVASVSGHGDINVGDSIGSATVQATLVLGLLPLIAGAFPIAAGRVIRIGSVTVAALALGALVMLDGELSRFDAALLVLAWGAGTALVWKYLPEDAEPFIKVRGERSYRGLGLAFLGLFLVGLGATTAVQSLVRLAEIVEAPEYLVAFLLASIGTSLPELIVDIQAVRRGQWDLAVGDALGSSFVDSTLSLAIGPLLIPVAVTSSIVLFGSIVAAAAIAFVTILLSVRKQHDWRSGIALIALFLLVYLLLLGR